MKKVIIIPCVILVLIGGAVAFGYFKYLYSEPLDAAERAALSPDWDRATGGNWSPWYDTGDGTLVWNPAASYNRWIDSVPADENAWAVYVDLYFKHAPFLRESVDLGALPPEMQDWESLREVLEEPDMTDDLELLLEAFTRPVLGAKVLGYAEFGQMVNASNSTFDPIVFDAMQKWGVENPTLISDGDANPGLLGVSSSILSYQRHLISLAQTIAVARFESGDVDESVRILDSISRSTSSQTGFPILINQLLAISNEARINRVIAYLLMIGPDQLTDQHLVMLDSILQRHQQRTYLWQGNALEIHDTVRRMTNADGSFSVQGMAGVSLMGGAPCHLPDARLSHSAQRALHTINLNERSVNSTLPWDGREYLALKNAIQNSKKSYFVRMMLDMLMLRPDKIGTSFRIHNQMSIGARLAVAVERHRLRHAAYPSSLGSIDPDFMRFEPIDAFGGELVYALTETGPMIYSKSDDRDDDHGAVMLKYDLDALMGTEPDESPEIMSRYRKSNKDSTGTRKFPLWITLERVKEIEAVEPTAVDGDWVLFPIVLNEPEVIEVDDE